MFRLKFYAATFALIIGLLTTFNQTARAESWSWENIMSVFSSENAVAVCTTNPVVVNNAAAVTWRSRATSASERRNGDGSALTTRPRFRTPARQ